MNAQDAMTTATHLRDLDSREATRAHEAAICIAMPICPLCGSADTDHAFKDSGCALRACNVCELFFVYPYPTSDRHHAQVSSGEYSEIELLDCRRRYQGEQLYYDRHFSAIAEECLGASSLLDVGCGTGHLLERFASRTDMRRLGIELNAEAAQFARCTAGCEIREVPLEQFRCDEKFDVITMINVFSHIPSFDGMFRSLRAALGPNGKLILRTSEMSRGVSRWNQVHWGIPDDLHFLGMRTIDFICARYGFEVVRRVQIPYEDELFRLSRWEQMGRSQLLNLAKKACVRVPGALRSLRMLYAGSLGRRLFVSLIVLKPLAESRAPSARTIQELAPTNGTLGGCYTHGQ